MALKNRSLFFGDNLHILREKFPGEEGYFDLIYLDPPFNSKRNYNVLFKEGLEDSPAQLHVFEDSWHWTKETKSQFEELVTDRKYPEKVADLMQGLEKIIGHNDVLAYLTMMSVRLIELYRVLKPTGSIYLHCDPTASHYLKIILDAIFGKENYRNEIVWHYQTGGASKKHYSKKHDIIFFYTKTKHYYFDPMANPDARTEKALERAKNPKGARISADDIYKIPMDVWDMPALNPMSKERLGYPTQKPESLLERIIKISSKEGVWILDPFGGCGTTIAVAEKLKRNWVMIDITTLAINLVKRRIEDMYKGKKVDLFTDGLPEDISGAVALFNTDPFEFEYWCCDLVDARPAGDKKKDRMKGADRGMDGVITFTDVKSGTSQTEYRKILVQVKGGHVAASQVRDFRGTIDREKAVGGVFITLQEPTHPMLQETIEGGEYSYNLTGQKFPKIQIITVQELLDGKRPASPFVVPYAKKAEKAEEDHQPTLFK
jgi:site-specific DNA-methyltransferase (adenine-specific)